MKVAKLIFALVLAAMAETAYAQIELGDVKLNGGGLFTMGYQGDYGDAIASDHGLDLGFNGTFNGYYYNPSFLSFSATPYWGRSSNNSSYQSLTNSHGVDGIANFFSGSHFPGSVNYHYDANSTGTLGMIGQPDFTTHGSSQGFGIGWSELLPGLPTLSFGYSQGSGNSTVYGTDEKNNSKNRLFNLHSTYELEGFRLTAYYNHNTFHSLFPQFLAGAGNSTQDSTVQDVGFGAQHELPLHGNFAMNYDRSTVGYDYAYQGTGNGTLNHSDYTYNTETANAIFHPSSKLSFNVSQNYTTNLSAYLDQSLSGGVPVQAVDLGTHSYSTTIGGGMGYNFTSYLGATAQATYYKQHFFNQDYTGQYLSGTINYNKKLLDTFTFSGSVIDSSNGQGTNALGFIGTVNMFHRFGRWVTTGQFSYAQNVQTLLVTYTTSYYSYNANVNRRLWGNLTWISSFSGNHSGLTQQEGNSSHSEGYSTSLSSRRWSINGIYSKSTGLSVLGSNGIVVVVPTPGVVNSILFNGVSYGGGGSVSPFRRLSISGTLSRAISDTVATTYSRNDTEIINAQLQYQLRRIGLRAGYTRYTQGISAIGLPANTTSYFVGVSRWFDFF
jgi:hypothetical protein